MKAELISVGTEILLGNIVNTNAAYLSEQMAALGFSVYFQTTVGDNEERLLMVLETALSRSDVIILSGGLGPTADDITKEAAAKAAGVSCYEDDSVKESIAEYFKKRNLGPITTNNWKQAMVPEGADILFNPNGTAPGLILRAQEGTKHIILLPGPPNELIPMFRDQAVPYLKNLTSSVIYSKTVKIYGLGESMVEDQITDLMKQQTNPTIAPYAKSGEVHLRVTARAKDQKEAEEMIAPVCGELKKRFGSHIYTMDEKETLEDCIAGLLKERGMTVTTVESCTGGLLAGRIIGVAGVSAVYNQGFITYSNDAKEALVHVKEETLRQYGAVSAQTAEEMAMGAAKATGADAAVSITGLAGPGGATKEKPVGLVYIGCAVNGAVYVKKNIFGGNRQKIRESSVSAALGFLYQCLKKQFV